MNNAEVFLNTFIAIEKIIKVFTDNNSTSFYNTLNEAANKNKVVKYYKTKLKEYADLRNAIVHERIDNKIIAEPNNFAVNDIKRIYNKLSKPTRIIDIIKNEVISLDYSDGLDKALLIMKEKHISQIPIYQNKEFKGMLDCERIILWLASNIQEDIFSIKETEIKDILINTNGCCSVKFKQKYCDIYEIIDIYNSNINNKEHIKAIIFTEHGRQNETPINIITDWDLPQIVVNL